MSYIGFGSNICEGLSSKYSTHERTLVPRQQIQRIRGSTSPQNSTQEHVNPLYYTDLRN